MSEYIGLKSLREHMLLRNSPFASLKREALLFDKIGILDLDSILEACYIWEDNKRMAESISLSSEQISEAHWLIENGVIFDARSSFHPEKLVDLISNEADHQSLLNLYSNGIYRLIKASVTARDKNAEEYRKTLAHDYLIHQAVILRLIAIEMEAERRASAIPLLSYSQYIRELPKSQRTNVIQIVIEKFPVPDDTTPWEKILEFRSDPEIHNNHLELRKWIRKFSSENLTPAEIEDELDSLIYKFQKQLEVHKMKANLETFEAVVKTPLKLIEDLVHLKFSEIPSPYFAFKNRQISLMEAELNSQGNEIAYLIKAKEAFEE